ncbi:MAG: prepilin-type N-terminal cleavage/methylation domain-containing protein [Candidatus Lindowbacteria bacterium]|nr:prepilin-type N-terminal cleavage/methylation domain-containing protein [Candidatus Lindowbacteria bacterium]
MAGMSLIEVLIGLVIISIAVFGILSVSWSSTTTMTKAKNLSRANLLLDEIYEEIIAMPRDRFRVQLSPSAVAPSAANPEDSRALFKSVLDYDGRVEDPPQDIMGRRVPGAEDFIRKIHIRYVELEDSQKPSTPQNSDLVVITVEVLRDGQVERSLKFLRSLL